MIEWRKSNWIKTIQSLDPIINLPKWALINQRSRPKYWLRRCSNERLINNISLTLNPTVNLIDGFFSNFKILNHLCIYIYIFYIFFDFFGATFLWDQTSILRTCYQSDCGISIRWLITLKKWLIPAIWVSILPHSLIEGIDQHQLIMVTSIRWDPIPYSQIILVNERTYSPHVLMWSVRYC